jgi:hypothetical protein
MGMPRIPKQRGAFEFNPDTGKWERVGRRLTRSTIGEQTAGFWLGQRGYMILDGPGGSIGHAANASGFDGVAWNPKTKDLIIYDNKAFRRVGNVSDASAITTHLEKNLEKQIAHIEAGRKGLPAAALKETNNALRKMRAALMALRSGGAWPNGVSLAVSSAGGFSKGVSAALAKKGIRFIDMNKVVAVVRPRLINRLRAKAAAIRFRKQAVEAELKALKKLAGKRAGGLLKTRVGKALEKAIPKTVGKMLLRASAKKTAGRVASLVPVFGWYFNAKDAVAGVEDIMRGHTARGLAGISLAAGDVAADFLHIGDAVSGVGGTALSLGAQGALVAGQIGIEIDRLKDKMEELQREMERLDGLPDEGRLRDYYEMDDEAIAELKQAMNQAPDESEPTVEDLPPPPDWGQDEESLWGDLPEEAPHPDSKPPAVPAYHPIPTQPAPAPSPGRWVDQPIA